MTDRVIVLIDMDCFYCQVESRLNPSLNGKPMAVVQYNQWKGGGIIAVNYEARDRGVTRHMRGAEAKEHCPEIILVTVPTIRDKADLTRYRDAGREVLKVFCSFTDCVQRASVDEAYIDLTSLVEEKMQTFTQYDSSKWKSTYVVGYTTDGCNDEDQRQTGLKSWLEDCESIHNTPSLRLAVGAVIVEEMREAVLSETGFKCSAGIAHNKILAKLACGLHKPNRQTVLPQEAVEGLYQTLPVKKIRNLGGKFGDEIVEKLGCKNMSDLAKYSEKELQSIYDEKNGSWLYNIARGYDFEAVTARLVSKSIGCCKKFPGKQALIKPEDVSHWLSKLVEELSERLLEDETMNKRKAQLLTVSTALGFNKTENACSKSIALSSYSTEKIVVQAESLLKKMCQIDSSGKWYPIKFLGLSAGKFSDISTNKIDKFFKIAAPQTLIKPSLNKSEEMKNETHEDVKSIGGEESKMSFFEKMFVRDANNSAKKLHLVPDLTKKDLFVDSDDSQSSLTKFKKESGSLALDSSRECVKKNLFTNHSSSESSHCPPVSLTETQSIPSSMKHEPELTDEKNIKTSGTDGSNKTIVSFFRKSSGNDNWTKPEELFPDINQVDEDLLSLLPEAYRNKILKMRKSLSAGKPIERIESGNTTSSGESNPVTACVSDGPNQLIKSFNDDINTSSTPGSFFVPSLRTNSPGISSALSDSICDSIPCENVFKCEECGEKVSNYELHMDMHLAKKLHKELNSYSTVLTVFNSEEKVKKKRKSKTKPTVTSNAKKIKSIETFFTKK